MLELSVVVLAIGLLARGLVADGQVLSSDDVISSNHPSQDVFSSTAELAHLATQELQFVGDLEELASRLEEEAASIRSFLGSHYGNLSSSPAEEYVSHPVNSLALISRLSHHLSR